jgi:hypothetical protein
MQKSKNAKIENCRKIEKCKNEKCNNRKMQK